ncbi:hypothetical protein HD554DRAFT_2178485 [Boletus coccyginus]|nr:hypothetical protein HD554DRAFT_2178485 [Boletus coccyginus]
MSLSLFKDILSHSKPFAVDREKANAADEVTALKIQLDGMTHAVPDEKDELQEEWETWCTQWQALVAWVHTTFQMVCKIGEEIMMRKAEEASQEMKGKEAEKVKELPVSDSPSEIPESALSAEQKRKQASRKVVLDEEEEEEVEEDNGEVQIVGKKSAQTQNDAGKVTHNPGCEAKVSPPRAGPSCRKSPPLVCPALPLFFDLPLPEDSAGEEEEDTPRRKPKTVKIKMHRLLGLLTELQAHAWNLEAYVATQQVELKALEATLNHL